MKSFTKSHDIFTSAWMDRGPEPRVAPDPLENGGSGRQRKDQQITGSVGQPPSEQSWVEGGGQEGQHRTLIEQDRKVGETCGR